MAKIDQTHFLLIKLSSCHQMVCVLTEGYVWLMEVVPLKEEWRFVSTTPGVLSVMTLGMTEMPGLSVINLGYHHLVRNC